MAQDGTTVDEHATPAIWIPGDWTKVVRRIRFDGVLKGVRGATLKGVAYALATYAEYEDGTRVRPGIALIAVDCELNYQTAKRCIAALRDLGLLTLVRASRYRGSADEYRLAVPADLLDRLEVLTPAQVELAVERVRDANRRRPAAADAPRTGATATRTPDPVQVPQPPVPAVDNPAVQVPPPPVQAPEPQGRTGGSAFVTDRCTGGSGTAVRVAPYPPTTHDRDISTTTHPDDAVRTAVTVVRAPEAEQDPIFGDGVDPTPPADPPSAKCVHGFHEGLRGDGSVACPACRRGIPAEPAPPPSNVVQLRPRRVVA